MQAKKIEFELTGVHPRDWETAVTRRSYLEAAFLGVDWKSADITAVVSDQVQFRKRANSVKFSRENRA